MNATVALRGIRRSYRDVVAVHNLDLDLFPGRVYGLLGPNGSGKSTTLRISLGLSSPDAGTVRLFGQTPNLAGRRRTGLVPEQLSLSERDRVGELLELMLGLRGFSRSDARTRAGQWLERMELGALRKRRISQLSKGQQQKAQIAMALAHDPDLLILDEPFTGLDPHHQRLISAVFREAADRGATVVLSTHRLREAQALIDEVVMMSLGHKVLEGSLRDLRLAHGTQRYRVVLQGEASWLEGPEVESVGRDRDAYVVALRDEANPRALLQRGLDANATLVQFEQVLPSLPELFDAHTQDETTRKGRP